MNEVQDNSYSVCDLALRGTLKKKSIEKKKTFSVASLDVENKLW